MKAKVLAVAIIALMCVTAVPVFSDDSFSETSQYRHGDFLVDYGNGSTKWINMVIRPTIGDTVIQTLTAE